MLPIKIRKKIQTIFIIAWLFTACNPIITPTGAPPIQTTTPPVPGTKVSFRVSLPEALPTGESIYLTILDEVTGLAFNPKHHVMEADNPLEYSINMEFSSGSVIKYRYTRQGANYTYQEHLSDDQPVRYRLYLVEGQGEVNDVISRWTDTQYSSPMGRITGRVADDKSGQPLPNILVTAGGAQSLTLSDGSFLLEGLPPGTHNLVAYALDGSYKTFQQGAVVEASSTTPANIALSQSSFVTINFTVNLPKNTPVLAPVRLAGNFYQFGNTYADLAGGVSTIASRMPILSPSGDGRYNLSIQLPSGADFNYKYTLGDGLWNAEHESNGDFKIRQLIVPDTDSTVIDDVYIWSMGQSAPINYEVIVPENTPNHERISIQFNLGYGWLESLPMWMGGNPEEHKWNFQLLSPLDIVGAIRYRYCREDQCGAADDSSTMGKNPAGRTVNTSLIPQTIVDEIESWAWLEQTSAPATVPNLEITPRGPEFVAGVAFLDNYHPSWWTRLPAAISDVKSIGSNWMIFTPSWTYTRNTPPVFQPKPGSDMLWSDISGIMAQARNLSLSVGLYPKPHFPEDVASWWENAQRDFSWWIVWFEGYRNFSLYHADLAAQYGASALILGGEWLNPALPAGKLADGSPSYVPEDAEIRWRALLQEIKAHFGGKIIWAVSYPEGIQNPPPFLDSTDMVLVDWSAAITDQPDASNEVMSDEAARLFDTYLLPFYNTYQKPILLGVSYPSANGSSTGCIQDSFGVCIDYSALDQPSDDLTYVQLDLTEQAAIYNSLFSAVIGRDWITGFISEDYYPPVILQDKSISVHGKPASGVLWYWFPNLVGE